MKIIKTFKIPTNGDRRAVKKFAWFPRLFAEYVSAKIIRRTYIWLEYYTITEKYYDGEWLYYAYGDFT